MIARPKISRNEWKTAEKGAFEVGKFALSRRPGGDVGQDGRGGPGREGRRGPVHEPRIELAPEAPVVAREDEAVDARAAVAADAAVQQADDALVRARAAGEDLPLGPRGLLALLAAELLDDDARPARRRAAEHAAEAALRDLAPHGHLEAAVEGHGPLEARRPDPGGERRQPLDDGAAHGARGGPTPTPTHGRNGRERETSGWP